ncbi:SDR family oxidoreductase [Photobacterium leiognathi]|uniref:SDR family oxidoreductase n=1 Tax=Photobacterium leiognathi TaxID=553611 RepID=UPI002980B91E|nr:sugar nucleotide-binding protein [Photobacterium leiognathi]
MNILILGDSGFVGNVVNKTISKDNEFSLNYIDNFRVGEIDYRSVIEEKIEQNNIEVIVNCIAMANVDLCEENKEQCFQVNVDFVRVLADICKDKNIRLIHISSNAVYGGADYPYSENSIKKPVNYYGECKMMADDYIEKVLVDYAIVRPITVYGPKNKNERHNPVTFYIEKLMKGENINLVDDNYVNMLHVDDLALCLNKILKEKLKGSFNLSGDISECRYDLGYRICSVCGFPHNLIKKVSGSEFKTKAKRPYNTSFDNTKMKKTLKIKPKNLDNSILEIYKKMKNEKNN